MLGRRGEDIALLVVACLLSVCLALGEGAPFFCTCLQVATRRGVGGLVAWGGVRVRAYRR